MFILKKKIEKKEQISIDDDKKRENASIENSLMKKVKIKNEFAGEQKKKKKRKRSIKLTLNVLRKGWVNIMKKKHLKLTQKEKNVNMVKFQMLLKKTTKMLKEKNRKRHKQ